MSKKNENVIVNVDPVAELQELIKDMLPYMQHKDDCLFGREQYLILIGYLNSTTDPKPCTCKMSEVLQRINERSK